MEAKGAPFTSQPLSVLRFTGIQSYGYTDQRKVETDVEVNEDRTRDLSSRKPYTSQLSHDYSCSSFNAGLKSIKWLCLVNVLEGYSRAEQSCMKKIVDQLLV